MSKLRQLNLQYHQSEDRVCLRVSTTDQEEFRFWMTRRFVRILWPLLMKLALADERVSSQAEPEGRNQVLSFQHEHAIQKTDFDSQFEANAERFPLGQTPMLLTRIQVKRAAGQPPILCLHGQEQKGIELAMGDQLLHSFCKLISDMAEKAEWDLDLGIPKAVAAAPAATARLN